MLWAVWIGLAIAVLTVAFGVYRAVRQVLDMFRSLKRLKREATKALEELTRATELLSEHPDPTGKLQPALVRLGRDRTRHDCRGRHINPGVPALRSGSDERVY